MADGVSDRLVVVSNRLPVVLKKGDDGNWRVEAGSGGLVTALAPVLRNRGGIWIGWTGATAEEEGDDDPAALLQQATRRAGYQLRPVSLTAEEKAGYYYGFSNEVIWPLFHDLQTLCRFDPAYWHCYEQVNEKFASEAARNIRPDDFVWVHDYQLMLVARSLRELGVRSKIGFFLHIPFPPLDMFVKLPWRFQILRALLEYDLIGLQTLRDRRNFVQCVRVMIKDVRIEGQGQVITLHLGDRQVRLGAFPIGIDFHGFARSAESPDVADAAWHLHEHFPGQQILLGVDRLDHSKGLPLKIQAFENALERYPDLRQKVTLIQVVVPSRAEVPSYQTLKTEIEQMVGQVNGRFSEAGWPAIHYVYRSLPRTELLAHYRASEIALVTPLKDGMNLVAKEFCASSIEEQNGVLILSEFAGAVAQLQHSALLVNPYDIVGVADAIYRAVTMDREERRRRMRALRHVVRKYDIFWWVDSYLRAAIAKNLQAFPILEDYIPQEESPQIEFSGGI
jgi:trehalose 6-phosphate synthase/phosphatase